MSCSRPPACSGVCRTVDPWCGTSDLCPAEWTGGQWLRWCRGQTTGQLRLRVRSVHTELPTTPPPPLATAPQHFAKCHSARWRPLPTIKNLRRQSKIYMQISNYTIRCSCSYLVAVLWKNGFNICVNDIKHFLIVHSITITTRTHKTSVLVCLLSIICVLWSAVVKT